MVLHLKQLALHSWNIALAGMASIKLLHHLEDLFGIPKSEASKCEVVKVEASSAYASDSETTEEQEATVSEYSKGEMLPPPVKR